MGGGGGGGGGKCKNKNRAEETEKKILGKRIKFEQEIITKKNNRH